MVVQPELLIVAKLKKKLEDRREIFMLMGMTDQISERFDRFQADASIR